MIHVGYRFNSRADALRALVSTIVEVGNNGVLSCGSREVRNVMGQFIGEYAAWVDVDSTESMRLAQNSFEFAGGTA